MRAPVPDNVPGPRRRTSVSQADAQRKPVTKHVGLEVWMRRESLIGFMDSGRIFYSSQLIHGIVFIINLCTQ
jgi:hypothetical protein